MTNLIRLRRLAAALSLATWAVIALILVAAAYALWLHPPLPGNAAALFPRHMVAAEITTAQLWLTLGLSALTVAALLWTLDQMRRLFDGFRSGEVLTQAAAARISAIGRGLVALALLTVVVSAAQSVLLSLAAPAGQRVLAVALSQSEIGFLLAGGLMTLIGWAMGEAAAVAEENRGFV